MDFLFFSIKTLLQIFVFFLPFFILVYLLRHTKNPLTYALIFFIGLFPAYFTVVAHTVAIGMGGWPFSYSAFVTTAVIFLLILFIIPLFSARSHIKNNYGKPKFALKGFGTLLGMSIIGAIVALSVVGSLVELLS